MSNDPRRLTRAQLSKWTSDPRSLRVIEQLIDTATVTNDELDRANILIAQLLATTAETSALLDQANAEIADLTTETAAATAAAAAAQAQLDLYMTPLAIDCQIRDAVYSLPTSPTVIKPQTVAAQRGITYDPATGIFTLPQSRTYSTFTILNASVPSKRTFYTYAEVNTGSGWVTSIYSGREVSLTSSTDGQLSTVSINYFTAGTQLRFPLWVDSAADLITSNLPGTTAYAPAYRIMIAA